MAAQFKGRYWPHPDDDWMAFITLDALEEGFKFTWDEKINMKSPKGEWLDYSYAKGHFALKMRRP